MEPRPLLLSSELDLLGNAERVVDLDAEIVDRAFERGQMGQALLSAMICREMAADSSSSTTGVRSMSI